MSEVSKDFDIVYDVRSVVTQSFSLLYHTRWVFSPGKVFSLVYDVKKVVSRFFSIKHNVLVPISAGGSFSSAYSSAFDSAVGTSAREFSLVYDVRLVATKSFSIVYDVAIVGNTAVTKSFSIVYHTLKTPTVDEIVATPISVDSVPPQIVTTTSF